MSWIKDTFSSSIGRKLLMSISGLFLIVFLVAHLAGNLSLLNDDGGEAFNVYAHFMKTNPLITLSEVILFAGFLLHIIDGIGLIIKNRKARPTKYAHTNKSKTKNWASKLMGPFGLVLLAFLIIHLVDFFAFKYTAEAFGGIDSMIVDGEEIPDLASKVYMKFSNVWYVAFYIVSMAVVGFHLSHGFQSAFQTLGLNHPKYNGMIKGAGLLYSIVVPLMFAMIPLWILLMR